MKHWWLILILGASIGLTQCGKDPISGPVGGDDPVYDPTPYVLNIPDYMPILYLPEDNPLTEEGVALGRMLFYDPILSADSTQSCASCHQQQFSFNDARRFSIGVDGIAGDRNAMPVINVAWMNRLFWDGRASSVEDQALGPVENPIEMHEQWDHVVEKLMRHPTYPEKFFKAFGTWQFTKEEVVKAIAQFERTLISSNSRYDQIYRQSAGFFFTDEELNGFDIFNTERGDCFHCHGGILFTDNLMHNNGLDSNPADPGFSQVTGLEKDRGKFKTPTLRNIALTAPYMHDGRFSTLEEVIDFYSEGIQNSPTIDPLIKNADRGGIHLNADEKKALIAFLHTLTDTSFVQNTAFSSPFK